MAPEYASRSASAPIGATWTRVAATPGGGVAVANAAADASRPTAMHASAAMPAVAWRCAQDTGVIR